MAAASMPFAKCGPPSAASRVSASTTSQNFSAGPNCSAISASAGATRMVSRDPSVSPVTEAYSAISTALRPCPFCIIL